MSPLSIIKPAEPSTQGTWVLTGCLPPSRTLSTFPVRTPSFVIGRKVGVDLQLASQCVSSRHAEILTVGDHLFVRDLESTNGTFVNRRRVKHPTPIGPGDHIEIADVEFRIDFQQTGQTTIDVKAQKKTAPVIDAFDADWTLSQFDNLIQTRAITPYFQPIVELDSERPMGYEALARTTMCGLESPALMFQTAQIVNREAELSILCRQRAVEVGQHLPRNAKLFINTHPLESLDVDVYPSLARLRKWYPDVQIVVELHEGSIQDPKVMKAFMSQIQDIGVQLAYDDFGAGQSRLLELTVVPPDYLKFDAGLIRDVDKASTKHHRMLSLLIQIAKESDAMVLAEGVETAAEAEVCRQLGFDLGQGYFWGKPQPLQSVEDTGEIKTPPTEPFDLHAGRVADLTPTA